MFRRRIALVGDAAHCMPPFRAQGLATGLRDASNVSWKIASVLSGSSHEQLLDTYQRERQPHVQAAIAAAEGMGSIICLRRPKCLWRLKNAAFSLANSVGLFEHLFKHFTPSLSISHGLIACSALGAGAAGTPLPNLSMSPCSDAQQHYFDEQFSRARGGKLRWCIVVVVDNGWPGPSAETSQALLNHVVVLRCCRSSAMATWLRGLRSSATLVRSVLPKSLQRACLPRLKAFGHSIPHFRAFLTLCPQP
jgi:hypothetical protein